MTVQTTGDVTFAPEDVRAVTGQVWESCLSPYGDPLSWGTGERLEGDVAQALIRVVGEWSGVITLEMSDEAAETAARVLETAATDEVAPEEVADAVGELVNIIGGNIKSLLPTPSTLSLPEVAQVAAPAAAERATTEHCRVDLSWGPRPIRVRVWS